MSIRREDAAPYVDPDRWASLARVKHEAWLARWRRGPARQLQAIDDLRSFAHSVGARASREARDRDLADHVRVVRLMRRAHARRN
jgi:hypothetical protein